MMQTIANRWKIYFYLTTQFDEQIGKKNEVNIKLEGDKARTLPTQAIGKD